jgi:hypothetical protein
VTGLRRRGRELSWGASCDAATYTVVIHWGKLTEHLSTKAPHIVLPKLSGSVTVTIKALDAKGHPGPTFDQSLPALAHTTRLLRRYRWTVPGFPPISR